MLFIYAAKYKEGANRTTLANCVWLIQFRLHVYWVIQGCASIFMTTFIIKHFTFAPNNLNTYGQSKHFGRYTKANQRI
jgi:hypothetical protein